MSEADAFTRWLRGEGPNPKSAPGYQPPPPRPPWWRRRWWRYRPGRRARLAGLVLAGAVLGWCGTAVAVDAPPFTGAGPDACWDTLSQDELDALGAEEAEEVAPLRADGEWLNGYCRLVGERSSSQETLWHVTVHSLTAGLRQDGDLQWAEDFLGSHMTPLGGELLGMASHYHAWVALPPNCVPGLDDHRFDPPVVVDIRHQAAGSLMGTPPREDRRGDLGRVVVDLANGVMRELGCRGVLPGPGELPPEAEFSARGTDEELCGVPGLSARDLGWGEDDPAYERVTPGDGPIRACDLGSWRPETEVRLLTITDQRLTRLYQWVGAGTLTAGNTNVAPPTRSDLAAYQAWCQTGVVVFVAQDFFPSHSPGEEDRAVRLVHAWITSEAERLGCAPLELPPAS